MLHLECCESSESESDDGENLYNRHIKSKTEIVSNSVRNETEKRSSNNIDRKIQQYGSKNSSDCIRISIGCTVFSLGCSAYFDF